MRLTGRQRAALSLVWPHKRRPGETAISAYFAWTDKGQAIPAGVIKRNRSLRELLFNHRTLPIIVEMWKEDFRAGLLFLHEFDSEKPALRDLAYRIYFDTFGFIPRVCQFRDEFLRRETH